MLTINDLTVRYPRLPQPALDNVSLGVADGEIVVLLGQNGAGKTSLMRSVCGLLEPVSGTVTVNGNDMVRRPLVGRRHLGVLLYPERSFYYRLTARQNLRFFAALEGMSGRHARRRIDELLDLLGLAEYERMPFMKYSLGMRKKLGLARALLTDPQLLLLDEPTANLDPPGQWEFLEMIRGLRDSGKSILVATHHLTDAERVSDRVAFLNEGRLVAVDRVQAFQERTARAAVVVSTTEPVPPDRVAEVFPGDDGVRARAEGRSIVLELDRADADIAPLLARLSSRGTRIVSAQRRRATLEDVFREVAGR